MEPNIQVNFLAVLVCVAVGMPLGYLWFGVLFTKPWAQHMGLEGMDPPGSGAMAKSMGLFALGNLLLAAILAHVMGAYNPESWNAGPMEQPWAYALNATFWSWLGFFLPKEMGRVAWEFKRWGLVAINSGFDLVRLLVFSMILAYWR